MWKVHHNAGGIKCGVEYCSYESEEAGDAALEALLWKYYEAYGTDLKAIRDVYCQCGPEDLVTFTQIYNEELNKLK